MCEPKSREKAIIYILNAFCVGMLKIVDEITGNS